MNALKKMQLDNSLYFEKALKIKDKDAEIIPFKINDSQDKLLNIIENHYTKYPNPKERPTLYIIILKARQQGMSTATEGLFFKAISIGMPGDTPYNKNAMVVSYDESSAQTINEMSDRFYQYLPNLLKPMKRNSRGKGLLLENPTNIQADFEDNPGLQSKFLIDTARNVYAGSGYTINYLHISELSKWEWPEETMKSLMQSVPKNNAIVIVESTANGAGDYFNRLWNAAEAGENDYIPLFLPWFSHVEYQTPFYSQEAKKAFAGSLDEEEQELIKLHGVTLEQLQWRRETIKNKCNGDVETFHQEYPSTAGEAFLMSGRPRFDIPVLREYMKRVSPGTQGNMEHGQFISSKNGYLTVWRKPEKRRQYFMGVDVARGLITGDYTAQVIYDEEDNLVAMWHGHMDPDLAAKEGVKVARWYNNALMVIEENNHGLSYINAIKDDYDNIYKRTSYNKVTDTESQQLGWWTSEQTKKLAVDHMAMLIRERRIGLPSRRAIQECMTYVIDDKGTTNAQNGCNDDIVMASAIVLYVKQTHMYIPQEIWSPGQKRVDYTHRHPSELEDKRASGDDAAWFRRAGW